MPISESLATLLTELDLKRAGKAQDEAAFVLPRLWEWTKGRQARITREFCKSIGVTPVKFHDLRATFITQLLLKGVSVAQVMAIVGHSELKTTDGYLRMSGSELQGVTNRLEFSLPAPELAKVIELRPEAASA